MVIRPATKRGKWSKHPIWQHVSPYTVVEFKSIHDPFKPFHWGNLMAYVGLTMKRERLGLGTEIAGWLVVPYINKHLKQVLERDGIELKVLYPGFHKGRTSFFPLVIVEYDFLPLEDPFLELKSFMKAGPSLLPVMRRALQKWLQESGILADEYSTIITNIHKREARQVIQVLEEDRPNLIDMANALNAMLKEEEHQQIELVRQKELEIGRKLLAEGADRSLIAKVTGLTLKQIDML